MRRAYLAIHSPAERDPSGTRFAPLGGSGLPSPASTSSDVPSGNTSRAALPRPVLIWWMSRTPGDQAGSGSPTVCAPAAHGSRRAVSTVHPSVLVFEREFASNYVLDAVGSSKQSRATQASLRVNGPLQDRITCGAGPNRSTCGPSYGIGPNGLGMADINRGTERALAPSQTVPRTAPTPRKLMYYSVLWYIAVVVDLENCAKH